MTWSLGNIIWILFIAYALGVFEWFETLRDAVISLITQRPNKHLSKSELKRLRRAIAERDVGIDLLRRIALREQEGFTAMDTQLGSEVDSYLERFSSSSRLRALDTKKTVSLKKDRF